MSRELLEPSAVSALERQLMVTNPMQNQCKPEIQRVGVSPLLSQLKQFLPQMQQANEDLHEKMQKCSPGDLDIEHIPDGQEDLPVIEMDLACGVLDLHDDSAVAAAQRAIDAGGGITLEQYDGGETDSSESDDEDLASSDALEGNGPAGHVASVAGVGSLIDHGCQQQQQPAAITGGDAALSGELVQDRVRQEAADAAEEQQEPAAGQQRQQHQHQPPGRQQQGQQQRTQQQRSGRQPHKTKPKKPMIVELS